MKPPSSYTKQPRAQKDPPNLNLLLEFVHGYRAKDCRNNLKFLPDGRIIYHAAGLGIVYEKESHSQTFFDLHTDDITAFSLDSTRNLCATGEVGRSPVLHI